MRRDAVAMAGAGALEAGLEALGDRQRRIGPAGRGDGVFDSVGRHGVERGRRIGALRRAGDVAAGSGSGREERAVAEPHADRLAVAERRPPRRRSVFALWRGCSFVGARARALPAGRGEEAAERRNSPPPVEAGAAKPGRFISGPRASATPPTSRPAAAMTAKPEDQRAMPAPKPYPPSVAGSLRRKTRSIVYLAETCGVRHKFAR